MKTLHIIRQIAQVALATGILAAPAFGQTHNAVADVGQMVVTAQRQARVADLGSLVVVAQRETQVADLGTLLITARRTDTQVAELGSLTVTAPRTTLVATASAPALRR
jgi:hypothetical protein